MALFAQPMQPPLEQPLKGRPTGPFYVTLVESTLFDGIFIWLSLVASVTNGSDTVRVGKTGLILNMPEIRFISSSYVLYGKCHLFLFLEP